ncbi:hypothetical protein OPIT5_04785 [Opitutaceae bacterium TAV5]|nr:hypothetical protein OPIT5_04785 [Opitutaceae bacterium TAV5]
MYTRKLPLLAAALSALTAFAVPATMSATAAPEARTVLADDLTQVTVKDARANQTATSEGNVYSNLGNNDIFQGSGPGLRVNGAWAAGYTRFDPVTLEVPGDRVMLRLTIRYDSAPANVGGALRLGLYDSRQDPATLFPHNPDTNPAGDSAQGYFVTLNTGGTEQTNLFRDPGDKTVTRGNATFTTSGGNRIVGFKGAAFGTGSQPVTLIIERTSAGLKFSGEVAGTPFAIGNTDRIGAPVTHIFDSLVFGSGNLPGAFTITGIEVTTNIRPSSASSP